MMGAMAVLAGGGEAFHRFGPIRQDQSCVNALLIGLYFVASLAVDRPDNFRVRNFLRVQAHVTMHTIQGGMDRVLKLMCFHKKRDDLTVFLQTQAAVGVTSQTVSRALRVCGCRKYRQGNKGGEDFDHAG